MMLLLSFAAFVNACLSYFLDFCFEDGNIFRGYYLRLLKIEGSFWFKPLGGCVVCSNIWQGLISFPLFVAFYGWLHYGLWLLPLCIAYLLISNFFIRKMI